MTNYLVNQQFDINSNNDFQFENLISKQYISKQISISNKEQAKLITREIPIQVLALEWLSKLDQSADLKTYLMENFLPILVLGCEKVLKEAQKKKLIEKNESNPNFNPINYLAQYLMRNNPSFNNQNEKSDYVRIMREVYQDLHNQMLQLKGHKLAKIKEDVKKRRDDRENKEKIRDAEITKRKSQIEALFNRFCLSKNGRLEIAIVIECLKMYNNHLKSLSDDKKRIEKMVSLNFPSYCYKRDDLIIDKRLLRNEFIESILLITEHLNNDSFDLFTEFFEECSIYFVQLANMNYFNQILNQLVLLVDSTNTGMLSRRRLIKLLKDFKEKSSKTELKNPLEWPVLDPFIKFENKLEQIIPNTEQTASVKIEKISAIMDITENQIPVQELIEPQLNENNKKEDNQASDNSAPIETENVTSEPQKSAEEEKNIAEKQSDAEGNLNEIDQALLNETSNEILAKPSIKKESTKLSDLKAESTNLTEIITLAIPKEQELLFMKGGKLYFNPLNQNLNLFDSNLLIENSSIDKELLLEFNPEFLNSKQFTNLINNYVSKNFLKSEINANDLIVYIKDNYAESRIEKNSKLIKVNTDKKNQFRSKRYSACFEKLDNEGSGEVNLNILDKALDDFKDGLFKEHVSNAINLIRSEITVNGKTDDLITRNEFYDLVSILVGLVDFPKFEDQLLNYLSCIYTYDSSEKTRGEIRKKWLSQIKYVGDISCGSFEPLFKQLFFTVLKDAENHGSKKNISTYVGVLESLNDNTIGLKYIASTPHDSKYVLGNILTRNEKNLSFNVIDNSKSEHVPSVRANENVYYFNPERKNDGSLLIFPLRFARNKVFGTLSVDTLQDTGKHPTFYEHELSFYQGVANTFADAYAHIIFKNRLIKTCISAIEWLSQRCKGIEMTNVYFVQLIENESKLNPDTNDNEKPNQNKDLTINLKPILKYVFKNGNLENLLNNRGNLTDEVLEYKHGSKAYDCAQISETTIENFNGKTSYFVPLRNEEHKTVLLLELTSEKYYKNVTKYQSELEEIETVLYVLHKCQEELLEAHFLGIDNYFYDFERLCEQDRFEILFEKCYIKYVFEKLNQNINEKVTMDSESSNNTKDLFKLIDELVENDDFSLNEMIDENLLNKLVTIDPTRRDYVFPSTHFDITNQKNLADLHEFYISLSNNNPRLRLLIDLICLLSNLKKKSMNILNQNK